MIHQRTLIFLLISPVLMMSGKITGQENLVEDLPILRSGAEPMNIVFILSDDHRYDFMGFTGKVPWLRTPNMDKLSENGCYVQNAFVTTALCSPSRASILTGQYSHVHKVVDNSAPLPKGLVFFPEYLQKAGYETSFFGKWHMGHEDDQPQPGFHHWESFRGQGDYYGATLNINGQRVRYDQSTYITDLLTDHAINWMKDRKKDQPFFLYLSHKAVHAMFEPSEKNKGLYADMKPVYPPSYHLTKEDDYKKSGSPEWVRQQRHSWHGVDYMYHGQYDFETFFRAYCETLTSLDESLGKLFDFLNETGLSRNTAIIYMGDNGFSFGEHGLIDKRHAYEESMRVPLLVFVPGLSSAGSRITELVQNIDIAPTILELANRQKAPQMQGRSIVPLLKGEKVEDWRDKIFYEYYWEYAFPQTPTTFAVRTGRYKYIRYQGIWDTNELYDLKEDPWEMNNLIRSAEHQDTIKTLLSDLWNWLEDTGGLQIPLKRNMEKKGDHLNRGYY